MTLPAMDPHKEDVTASADHQLRAAAAMSSGSDLSHLNINQTDFNAALNFAKQLEMLKAQVGTI